MNQEQLSLAIDLFEFKIIKLEKIYKEKHKDNFEIEKMKKFINKKLKSEIQILNYCNIMPSVRIVQFWIISKLKKKSGQFIGKLK